MEQYFKMSSACNFFICDRIIKCGYSFNIKRRWLYHRVMCPEDADVMANSIDPDKAVRSGSTVFARTCSSENLGSL